MPCLSSQPKNWANKGGIFDARKSNGRHAARSRNGVKGLLKTLFSYAGNRRVPIFIALILAAAGAILTILGPNQLSRITDLISESLLGQIDLAAIGQVGGLLLAI